MPVNALIVRALLNLYLFYGDDFKVQCPTGSGHHMTLFEVAQEISRRLAATFLRDESGKRPVYGGIARFQDDPHWRDLILFHEYLTATMAPGSGPVTRPDGPAWSLSPWISSAVWTPKWCSSSNGRRWPSVWSGSKSAALRIK